MAIDTLSIARELRSADVPAAQAEAIAAAIGRSAGESLESAATKADLASVSFEMSGIRSEISNVRSEISNSEARLETKIEAIQSKLIMWFVGTQITIGALVVALLKL